MTVRFDRLGILDAGALLAGLVAVGLFKVGNWLLDGEDPNEDES